MQLTSVEFLGTVIFSLIIPFGAQACKSTSNIYRFGYPFLLVKTKINIKTNEIMFYLVSSDGVSWQALDAK